jgi:GNAT superfamily N-acetyltransferase
MNESKLTFRKAVGGDAPLILKFIRALAEYEHLEDEMVATEDIMNEWLFEKKTAEVIFPMIDGVEIGYALYFYNFSTFLGRSGIYLEDFFIEPEYRGRGCGKATLRELARIALERGCGRLEWVCLDWNKPSIDFYLSLGAKPLDDWTVYRLAGNELSALANAQAGTDTIANTDTDG